MKLYTVHISYRDETAALGSVDARETAKTYVLDSYCFEEGFNKKLYHKEHLGADLVAITPEEAIRLFRNRINSKISTHEKAIKAFERRRLAVELLVINMEYK